jgi:hypothetical protein
MVSTTLPIASTAAIEPEGRSKPAASQSIRDDVVVRRLPLVSASIMQLLQQLDRADESGTSARLHNDYDQ